MSNKQIWEMAHIFPAESEFRYVEGFKMAAEALVDRAYDENDFSWWADSLLYPIGYVLRHYLELKLKSLLALFGETPKPRHNLLEQWQHMCSVAGPMLPRDRTDEEQAAMNARFSSGLEFREHQTFVSLSQAEAIVLKLDELDPSGEAFRYAYKKDGTPTLPSSLSHVDLKELLGEVLSVGMLLDGIETAVDEDRNVRNEMREYYREE